ncbi:MAG: hypothetical protein AVDCRST_MAG40-2689, partial [uncultured Gemmatimonadaceae bacterium]
AARPRGRPAGDALPGARPRRAARPAHRRAPRNAAGARGRRGGV